MKTCLTDCSGHGICESGKCKCDLGWSSENCKKRYVIHGDCSEKNECLCRRGIMFI
jgi:hypothetical protein